VRLAVKVLAMLALASAGSAAWAQEKVVYHFDGGCRRRPRAYATFTTTSRPIPRRRSLPSRTRTASIS